MPALNPFIYGKPVPTGSFIGRESQMRTLFSRLFNGESTAIVGEPHIGKSSLLQYISAEKTRRKWIKAVFDHHIFVSLDCQLLPSNFSSAAFWRHVLDEVQATTHNAALHEQAALTAQNNFGSLTLERLFKLLAKLEWRLVLLMDEFDAMLNHPNFNTAEFLGALRSFATRTDGLVVITASRLSVSQMNRLSLRHNPHGSPFFNSMTEVKLPHLSEIEATSLIDTTLKKSKTNTQFSAEDHLFLLSLAGRQPFLLQVAAASLYDARLEQTDAAQAHDRAAILFQERSVAHFEDLARTLEANTTDLIRDQDRIDRTKWREQLASKFSKEELKILCFNLNVDYEDLPASGRGAMAMQLILFCQHRGLIQTLRDECHKLRPDLDW